MAHAGSWNIFGVPLPDFGVTERIADAFGQSRNQQGGSQLRQGTIANIGNVPYYSGNVAPTSTSYGSTQLRGSGIAAEPGGVVDNGGGGGGGDTGGGGGGGPDNNALQTRLNGIMQRLQLMKGEGERLRGVAKGVRDEVFSNIGVKYGGLAKEALTKRDDSLAALAEADRGTVRDYAITQGQTNRSAENAKLKNRIMARALGYGNGSFYQNMQSDNTNTLVDNTFKLGNERSSKLAGIKKDVAGTNTWYDQKSLEIDNEKKTLESQADREYQDNISKSLLAEQNYGIDSVDAAAQAESDYYNKLSQINSYVSNKQSILDNVAKVAGTQSTGINARPNIQEATGKLLATNTAADQAQNTDWGTITGNPTGINSVNSYAKTLASKVNPWDEYIYGNKGSFNA